VTGEPQGRLRWRCRRGMKELDLLLVRWFDLRWSTADARRQQAFQRLLEEADPQIADWLFGGSRPADTELAGLVDDIIRSRH
jgi:antitoxin CptB